MSLFYLCTLSIEAYGGEGFQDYMNLLQLMLTKDFPHKKDMEIVVPWLYTIHFQPYTVSQKLNIDPLYEYAPSVQPLISFLSFYHLSKVNLPNSIEDRLDVYEMLCRQFLQNGHYYEACELHFLLFLAYYLSMKTEAMFYHLRKGLTLVKEHRLYAVAICYAFYYQNVFDTVLKEFPEDFADLIRQYSELFNVSYSKFTAKCNITEIYSTLSQDDYPYLIYMSQGNTNKEIANILKVSQRTVSNHFAEIYNKLGVDSKQDLMSILVNSLKQK